MELTLSHEKMFETWRVFRLSPALSYLLSRANPKFFIDVFVCEFLVFPPIDKEIIYAGMRGWMKRNKTVQLVWNETFSVRN